MAPKNDPKPPAPPRANSSRDQATAKDGSCFSWNYDTFKSIYYIFANVLMGTTLVVIALIIYVVVVIAKYNTHETGRIFGLVIVGVLNIGIFVLACKVIYEINRDELKKISKLLVSLAFLTLAVLELGGISLAVFGEQQEQAYLQWMKESFDQSDKHIHRIENTLKCCGLDGPEDYRLPDDDLTHPPNISVACCQAYDPYLEDQEQNETKLICRHNRSYHTEGCKVLAVRKIHSVLTPLLVSLVCSSVFLLVLFGLGMTAKYCGKDIQPSSQSTRVA